MKQYFSIIGSSRVLPAEIIQAEELDHRLGLRVGWTAKHTGVLRRHRMAGVEEAESLTRRVVQAALTEAGLGLRDLDGILDASLSLQQPIPCNAARLQRILGAEAAGIPCFDVHASCLGFVAALTVANGLFASQSARRLLIVTLESPLVGVNWKEPESACLMGDAVTAFVLEAREPIGPCALRLETFSEGLDLCEVRGGGHRLPSFAYTPSREAEYRFHMDGKAVHHLASRRFPPFLERVLKETECRLEELEVVPHQASGPALEFMRRRLGIPESRFHVSIAEHGNLVAASIPYVLDGLRRQRPRGTRVLLLGTAAGYTQAGALFSL